MYGTVNNAFQETIEQRHGHRNHDAMLRAANVDTTIFINEHSYPDSITYALVNAACMVLDLKSRQQLEDCVVFRAGHTPEGDHSDCPGLTPFVLGLRRGIREQFGAELVINRKATSEHNVLPKNFHSTSENGCPS